MTSTLTSLNWAERPGWCEPRTATVRCPHRRSLEPRVEGYAPLFGFDAFWGWQHHVLGPALELDPDGTWHYRTVVVIVGRQSGKTTGLLALRAFIGLMRGEKIAFSAQNRVFGREKWEEIVDCLAAMMGPQLRVSKRIGSEMARVPGGGVFRLVTPTSRGARSFTCDTILADEAAYIPTEYLAAARPTMVTRANAQIWLVSSAGGDASEDLARGRAAGHADLRLGVGEGRTAVFEWGAKQGDDYGDHGLWERCMPTLGQPGGARWEALISDWKEMSATDFAREYLGVWDVDPLDRPLGSDVWSAVQTADVGELESIVFGLDVAPDQSSASLAACGRIPGSDRFGIRLLFHGAGDDWVPAELEAAWRRFKPMSLVVDERTPAAAFLTRCEQDGKECVRTTTSGLTAACAGIVTRATLKEIDVHHDDVLTNAALSACRRSVANGWAFDRRKLSDGRPAPPISPIVAAALALNERAKIPAKPAVAVLEDVATANDRQRLIEGILGH